MNKMNRFLPIAFALIVLSAGCVRKSEAAASASDPAAAAETVHAAAPAAAAPADPMPPAVAPAAQPPAGRILPRLVDIGAGTCIPCKMMKPILEDLMANRAHQFETIYIDLNREREKGLAYGIRIIPTQVFFDENGRELARHEGFLSKEQILAAWQQLGYAFGG